MEREQLFRWDEIEPLCILRLLARKLWLIVLAALTGMMAGSKCRNTSPAFTSCKRTTPTITPLILPMPPMKETPPITQAAMASSS